MATRRPVGWLLGVVLASAAAVTTTGCGGGAPAASAPPVLSAPSVSAAGKQLSDFGRVVTVDGVHSVVLGLETTGHSETETSSSLRGYAAIADAAIPRVEAVWGTDGWPDRAVLEVPGTEAQFAALLDGTPDAYRQVAAAATGELGAAAAPTGRVLINPDAFASLSAVGKLVVLTHEVTHIATFGVTTPRTPAWLREGVADYTGYRDSGLTTAVVAADLRTAIDAGREPAALPTDSDFEKGGADLLRAYESSWLACRLIAERYGEPKLTAFYAAAGADGVDGALRATLGTTLDRFTSDWRTYMKQAVG